MTLWGCGDPGESVAKTRSGGSPSSGGTLRLAHEPPRSLDPSIVDSVYESLPVNQIFDGLVGLDPSLNVVPGLASTWTLSRDGRTYTFHLRPSVRFHDGEPLTADDVAFSIERVLAPGRERGVAFSYLLGIVGAEEYAAGLRDDLPGVRAIDPQTVRIELERPYLSFLEVLAMDGLLIVPRHAVEALGDDAFERSPVGTGPFRLAHWDDDHLHLEAYPEYFAGAPHLEGINIRFLDDDEFDAGAARFDRGELDVLQPATEDLDRLAEDPAVRVYRYQELSLSFLGLLTGAPPLDDERVRLAVSCAIDRESMAAQSPAVRRLAAGILPPGMPAYSPRAEGPVFDPERARRLLEEAGYPGGKGLRTVRLVTTARSAAAIALVEQIRADLEKVGIGLKVEDVGWGEFSERLEDHSAPAFLLAWIADLPDPDAFLRTLFEAGGSANYFDFHDGETWKLLEDGAREMNPVERARIYRETEERILALAPIVPLYHTMGVVAMRENVRGLEPGPMGLASVNFEQVWFANPEADS
jgi:peptide/nickel transport system substrate-binding protein/oligopeptide transport system substrate-binding protein